MAITGEIRQLKYGILPHPSPTFVIMVGQRVGGRENLVVEKIIKEIVVDGSANEYHIVCKKHISGEVGKEVYSKDFVWKTYHSQPDEVQYFVPSAAYDYINI